VWSNGTAETNATVFDERGAATLERCVGDGVAHVQTTPSGAVWIGYFDEGVYGNLGWGEPGAPSPIGASGLLRTGSDLEIDWRYPGDELLPIDDCYALNVDGETCWAYFYADFALARIEHGNLRLWATDVDGAGAFATDGERVALAGGYGKERDRLVLGRLGAEFRRLRRFRLRMSDGRALPAEATMVGRGDTLHVFVGREWYRLGLSEIP
jgi:hypothetical protein